MYSLRNRIGALKQFLNISCKQQFSVHPFTLCVIPETSGNLMLRCICSSRNVTTVNKNERLGNDREMRDEYKMRALYDPDTFGTLSPSRAYECVKEEEQEEEDEMAYRPDPKSKLRIKQYADLIKGHLQKKELNRAIDVLETRMLKEDCAKPNEYIYALLIGACGRYGYTSKAFKLYNQMKKRALKVPDAVYTGLFNACANSPWRHDGLERAKHLRELMVEKAIQCNVVHYHAMIKAFGRCNDLTTAFEIVDEMVDKKLSISAETFNFLLQACATDKEQGFQYSLLIWRKMLQRNIKPEKYSFNLLLRCVRDCNIGNLHDAQKIIELCRDQTKYLPTEHCNLPVEPNNSLVTVSDITTFEPNYPNLLARHPFLGNLISVQDVMKPQDRLLLVGGAKGFIECMKSYNETPDIKTYTLLLDCIPSTIAAEKALILEMEKNKQQFDIDFLNMLIKRRNVRFDYEGARDVLHLISEAKLVPDVVTFGVLSLGCKNEREVRKFVFDMRKAGYRLNIEILGAWLKTACLRHDFQYAIKVLHLAKEEGVKPDEAFYDHIDKMVLKSREIIEENEKGSSSPEFKMYFSDFKMFMYRYNAWSKEMGGRESIIKQHPWAQFRSTSQI